MKIELLYGDEPYCVWYHKHKAIEKVEMPEFNLGIFDNYLDEVQAFCTSYPMMAERKLCIIQVEDLKVLDTKEFGRFLKEDLSTCDVLIIPEKADKRTKFFKSLTLHACDKLKDRDALTKMIVRFLEGSKIEKCACDELIRRLNYFDNPDVNLFTVRSVCQTLSAFCGEEIRKEAVEALVENYEEDNAFILISLVLNRDIEGINRQADLINRSGNSPIGAICAMLREYRIAYKLALGFTPKEIGVGFSKLKGVSLETALRGMRILTEVVEGIKIGKYPQEMALTLACERLMLE